MRTTAQYFAPAKNSTTGSRKPPSFEVFASVCETCYTDSTGVGVALKRSPGIGRDEAGICTSEFPLENCLRKENNRLTVWKISEHSNHVSCHAICDNYPGNADKSYLVGLYS